MENEQYVPRERLIVKLHVEIVTFRYYESILFLPEFNYICSFFIQETNSSGA